jgi:hypothetical protein
MRNYRSKQAAVLARRPSGTMITAIMAAPAGKLIG